MSAYYNEFDPFAAAWLRELIKAGHIAAGDVDERDIREVNADEIKGYTQCHFFAGIGGWSLALRYAMWGDSRSVWTGSAPCQPFSSAGNQKGKDDERHLFPCWLDLIRECRPAVIYGEQVASAIAHGWLDDVYQGLEAQGYAVGAAVLPACSVGAPHRRDRLWFVANASGRRCSTENQGEIQQQGRGEAFGTGDVGNTNNGGLQGSRPEGHKKRWKNSQRQAYVSGGEIWAGTGWAECADHKQRPIKSGLPLLAHGVSNRVGKLRGYGNAIVPQVAAEFIKATM